MIVKDVKDLEKVIKLARKLGVESMKVDNVEFHLGAEPKTLGKQLVASIKEATQYHTESPDPLAHAKVPHYAPYIPVTATDIDTPDELTEEQLLFYSAASEQS